MPATFLTDIVAKTARPILGRQYTIWDRSLRGFGLRVGAEAKTWTVMVGKDRRRITIGRYPTMGLQVARSEAKKLMLAASVARNGPGITPIGFATAFEKFAEVHLPTIRESTAEEYQRILRKHFERPWKNRLTTDITRADVNQIIDRLVVETPSEANHAFAVVRLFLRWSVRRGYLENSPCEAMRAPAKHKTRDRVLTGEELKIVLLAAQVTGVFGSIVKVLALTAQRRGEIASLRSEWIDRHNMLITFPRSSTKNNQEHVLPLTPFSLGLLPEHKGLLFPARGQPDHAFNGWSNSMDALRRTCGVPDFRIHDLRRTAATMMAGLGVAPHILERILNHVTGSTALSITPLGRIYNRHLYLDEMRAALTRWEAEVLRLLRN